jgi:hypothetical protein
MVKTVILNRFGGVWGGAMHGWAEMRGGVCRVSEAAATAGDCGGGMGVTSWKATAGDTGGPIAVCPAPGVDARDKSAMVYPFVLTGSMDKGFTESVIRKEDVERRYRDFELYRGNTHEEKSRGR